jgi:hypothetical protein
VGLGSRLACQESIGDDALKNSNDKEEDDS